MINVKPAWVVGAGRKGMEWGFDCTKFTLTVETCYKLFFSRNSESIYLKCRTKRQLKQVASSILTIQSQMNSEQTRISLDTLEGKQDYFVSLLVFKARNTECDLQKCKLEYATERHCYLSFEDCTSFLY